MASIVHPTKGDVKKQGIKNRKYDFGICRISRKNDGGHLLEALGSGFLVRLELQHYLVTSNKVIPNCSLEKYYLEFKQYGSAKLERIKVNKIVSSPDAIHRPDDTSGLIFIAITLNNCKKLQKLFKERFFNVVNEDFRRDKDLYCYFVDDSQPESFNVKHLKIQRNDQKEFEIHEAFDIYKSFGELTKSESRKPYGGVILKRINGEFNAVGALQFTNDERKTISPVFFPLFTCRDREKRPSNSSPTVLKDGKIVSSSRRPADQLQDAHFSDKHLSHPTLGEGKMPAIGSATELKIGPTTSGSGRRKEQQDLVHVGDLAAHDQHSSHLTQDREKRPSNSSLTLLEDGKIVSSSRRPADQLQDVHFSDQHISHPTLGEGKMPPNGSTTELENAATASGSGRWKEQYLAGDLATHGQHSSHPTQGSAFSNKESWLSYLTSFFWNSSSGDGHGSEKGSSANGNLSENPSVNGRFVIRIDPPKTPLQGGGPCCFLFDPDLPPDITTGNAIFDDLGFLELNGVKNVANCLFGRGIPPADKEGWVTVVLNGKSNLACKSMHLGETTIFYFDERKKVLKQMVEDENLFGEYFEKWAKACKRRPFTSRDNKLNSTSSGSMDPDDSLQSLQGLQLLVYTAAETGAQQFIELIFNSSAARVVFNAYRDTSPLPEDVARDYGYEDTAQYLESITKRLSEDLSTDQEHLQASHILELDEAVQKQLCLHSKEDEYHPESNQTVGVVCREDADTLSSGSSELQNLSSRDKILPKKDDDTMEGSVSEKAEEQVQTSKLQDTIRRAFSQNKYDSAVLQPTSSESGSNEDGVNWEAKIFHNQELNVSATFDAGISPNAYSEASGVIIESHLSQELGVLDAAAATDVNSIPNIQASGNENSAKEITSSISYLNQEEADSDAASIADPAMVNVAGAGDTQMPTEVAFEVVGNSNASHHCQELIDLTAVVSSYENRSNFQNLHDRFFQEEAENTCDKVTTGNETAEEEEAVGSRDPPSAVPDDARGLKNGIPAICPESDDKQSDFSEGDKPSSFLSPFLTEMCETKDKEHGQDTKVTITPSTFNRRGSNVVVGGDSGQLHFQGPTRAYFKILEGRARCYVILGTVFTSLGEYLKAKEYLLKALAIRTEIGDRNGEATAYKNQYSPIGEYVKAKEYLEKALAVNIEIGDLEGDGRDYANLGTVFTSLGEYVKAKEYLEKALAIRIAIGDRKGEATAYENLGTLFTSLGEYVKAKEYLEKALAISIEIGDRKGEGRDYANLGTVFLSLGEYTKAKEYLEKALAISTEIGTRKEAARDYGNLGTVFTSLGEYDKAKEYLEKALAISIDIGDRKGEARDYANLGTVFTSLGEYVKGEEYLEKALAISIEISDRKGEPREYKKLGISLSNYEMAGEYLKKALTIRIEIGDRKGAAEVFINLGDLSLGAKSVFDKCLEKALLMTKKPGFSNTEFEILIRLTLSKLFQRKIREAFLYLFQSIEKFEGLGNLLGDNDHLKMSFLEEHGVFPYQLLSRLLWHTSNRRDALVVEELCRARGLADLMATQYTVETQFSGNPQSWFGIENIMRKESNCVCLYISYYEHDVHFWIIKTSGAMHFQEVKLGKNFLGDSDWSNFFVKSVRSVGKVCEDQSSHIAEPQLMSSLQEIPATLRLFEPDEEITEIKDLSVVYKKIIAPVVGLLDEPEVIIVPNGRLYKVPFAALSGNEGKYLSEVFRIRIVPSLTTLKLIQDSPPDYHSQTGALIVGDPEFSWVIYRGNRVKWSSLPCARKEAEMVGRLVGTAPLLGKRATKWAVLEMITSVSLVHFATHGTAERGEIVLSPNGFPLNTIPQEEDYLLTMSDISNVRLRAKLVVLSCCHSGSKQVTAEGVAGLARAFLGCGARSVLTTMWAIEDTATEQLMSRFYEHLVDGESASESLHQAMKWMRSNGFKVSQWAPFTLIGDNVTFEFRQ